MMIIRIINAFWPFAKLFYLLLGYTVNYIERKTKAAHSNPYNVALYSKYVVGDCEPMKTPTKLAPIPPCVR